LEVLTDPSSLVQALRDEFPMYRFIAIQDSETQLEDLDLLICFDPPKWEISYLVQSALAQGIPCLVPRSSHVFRSFKEVMESFAPQGEAGNLWERLKNLPRDYAPIFLNNVWNSIDLLSLEHDPGDYSRKLIEICRSLIGMRFFAVSQECAKNISEVYKPLTSEKYGSIDWDNEIHILT